ncbi:hypothetical protein COCON_G00166790 [Conger conger]|uniref:Uncharacterized protein n=1 Tax=Conger conger TaxID=82655 RepID=A0A9Q1D763_CONCO|nr:hypothetical protein COCON_G00166790 [Conger conger]
MVGLGTSLQRQSCCHRGPTPAPPPPPPTTAAGEEEGWAQATASELNQCTLSRWFSRSSCLHHGGSFRVTRRPDKRPSSLSPQKTDRARPPSEEGTPTRPSCHPPSQPRPGLPPPCPLLQYRR